MASFKYTYDQAVEQAKKAGIYDQIDDADWKLGQKNPDALMSIISYKIDYNKPGATDQQRALANEGANQIRAGYGEYTGGGDGSKLYLTPLSPGSFEYGAAPIRPEDYGDTYKALLDKQLNYGSFSYGSAPDYTSRNDGILEQQKQNLLNRKDFEYDAETDPLYAQYRKQYTREGQRATENAIGQTAAASGGMPSSYTATAAAQAGNYYASQMTDKIPELYQLAYQKYSDDYNRQLSDIAAIQSYEQMDRDLYNTKLQQYNTDRAFDYGAWKDQYNMGASNIDTVMALDRLAEEKYKTDLGQYNTDRSFDYGKLLDEIDSQTRERQEALDKAKLAYGVGDNSFFNRMGIDTSNDPAVQERQAALESEQWQRQYQLAAAHYEATGDSSWLDKLLYQAYGVEAPSAGGEAYVDGPGGYNNGALSESQIAQMQAYYGVSADGMWGPNSAAAAGGLSAAAAWQKMLESGYAPGSGGSGGSGSSGGSGGSGGGGGGENEPTGTGALTEEQKRMKNMTGYELMQETGDMLTSRSAGYSSARNGLLEKGKKGMTEADIYNYLVAQKKAGKISDIEAEELFNEAKRRFGVKERK